MFLHPDAADGQGHIAWGYRLDGGDYFEFGSTDDVNSAPRIEKGQPNGFWEKDGTRQDMLSEFRRLGYKQYRCRPTENNDITAAEEAATGPDGAEHAGYDVLLFGNNCLDHSVRILTAYGASQFPSAKLHPQPKNWFIQFLSPWSGPTDL